MLTRRHRHVNSSASAPLKTTTIAVMKVSDVVVVLVGPELLFLIYKCCFWAFFAQGRDSKKLPAELTLAQRGSVNDGPVGLEVAPPSMF